MVIRIALQCNEADAYLIMDEDNPAPRLLSRPGEGIYNDTAGIDRRQQPVPDRLAAGRGARPFSGENPRARRPEGQPISGADCVRGQRAGGRAGESGPLRELLLRERHGRRRHGRAQARIWLGAPNSIKGPTEAVFQRQSGSNLLIVGQREERDADAPVRRARLAGRAVSAGQPRASSCSTARRPGLRNANFCERVIRGRPARNHPGQHQAIWPKSWTAWRRN